MLAERVPVFKGTLGLSRGQQAIKFEDRITRRRSSVTDNIGLAKKA